MAQPSVANYFNTRKRLATEDDNISRAKRVLVLDSDKCQDSERLGGVKTAFLTQSNGFKSQINKVLTPTIKKTTNDGVASLLRAKKTPKRKLTNKDAEGFGQRNIEDLLKNMGKETVLQKTPDKFISEKHVTPPNSPVKVRNAMDKVNESKREPSIKEIRMKVSRSARLAELKASLSRYKEGERKLEEAAKKTAAAESPKLKTFKTLDLEVIVSPKKVFSPDKSYLSPKKEPAARKNLLNLLSPTKNAVALPSSPRKDLFSSAKPSLTLPFKYRSLAEIFRAIDTVCQILYNRKEVITFKKLKPAVEEMLKKNLYEKHLAQIKNLYDDAFKFSQEKLRTFGAGTREEKWELVVTPNVDKETITSEVLLERRRKLYDILIEKLKDYHGEFLSEMDPPMDIPRDKITRWHPEFDIERVPDIEATTLPQPPDEIKMTTGKEVLARAKVLFNCNTRMEEALARLEKHKQEKGIVEEAQPEVQSPHLRGIPKALLEKVRQRQAAKTLMNLTRSSEKEKLVQMYNRLPEIARVTRNVFIAEKKGVLPLSVLIDKLENSLHMSLTFSEMQEHLRIIEKEIPGWLVFHDIRHSSFVKLAKSADVSLVISKLSTVAKQKEES